MAYTKQNFEDGKVLYASQLNNIEAGIVTLETAVGKCLTSETDPTVPAWAKASKKPTYTASEVGADASGTATSKVSTHDKSTTAHTDIRDRIAAVAGSSDIVCSASGGVVAVNDSSERELVGLRIFGKTTQNGTPAPEAPVPLESVGNSVKTSVCGRNIFPYPYEYEEYTTSGGIRFTADAHGFITANGTTTTDLNTFPLVKSGTTRIILPPGDYFLSGCPSGGSTTTYSILLRGVGSSLLVYDTGEGKLFNITEETQIHCTIYFAAIGVTADNLVFKPMLTVGKSATPFECKPTQYATVSTPKGLPGIPVSSDGQQWICDEVDFEKGQYIQRVETVVLDGDENLKVESYQSYKRINCETSGADTNYRTSAISSHFKKYGTKVVEYGMGHISSGGKILLYLSESMQSFTTAQARAWLAENLVTVQYVLAQENRIDLSAEELAQFAALRTNYPNTTVFNDGGADMEVSYVADTKLYIDKKFAELATALVNN